MANMIARLGVVLGLDTAEFNKGIEAAGKKLEQFSQAAERIGKGAAVAMVAAGVAAVRYADELADVAKANDVAIGTVLKLSNALANSGGKADDAGKMLASFTKFIDEAAGGSLQAQKTATLLGVSLKDLGKLSEEELLNKFVKNLGRVEDSVTRNAKGMEIFGRSFKGIDAVGFADIMADTNKTTDAQAEAIQKAADAYDKLGQNARETMVIIASSVGPILLETIDYMKQLQGETGVLGQVFKTVFQTVVVVVSELAYQLNDIVLQMQTTVSIFKSLIPGTDEETTGLMTRTENERNRRRALLDEFHRRVMGEGDLRNSNDPRRTDYKNTASAGRPAVLAKNPELEAAKRRQMHLDAMGAANAQRAAEEDAKARAEFFASYEKGNAAVMERQRLMGVALDNEKEMMLLEMKSSNMRQEDFTLERERLQIRQQLEANLEEIGNRRDLTAKDRADAEAREVALSEKALGIAYERYQLTVKSRQGTFEEGFQKNAMKFIRDMPTELENGAKAFDSMVGNMESALDRFVRTGKLNFKDLARSIIQDLIAIQLKASASAIFKSFFGIPSNANTTIPMQPGGGYADGGDPPVGRVSVVGERGPELFVPRTAGTIIPNHALSGMGGNTNITNNYINAIDTKSFEDRLLGSSNAIWAANTYANKTLAVNRGRA